MSDAHLVRHCAPTLAGIKTASLFTCPFSTSEEMRAALRRLNQRLKPKGLRILPLRYQSGRALIYLYRPKKLVADLSCTDAAGILRECGYVSQSCEKCVCQLIQKIRQQEDFPHEIGLFLGYPPEDVRGFIEYGPDCCKCTGCWKVYGDEVSAKKKFDQYKKCTKIYCRLWENGKDIERLTVAG